MDDKVIKTAFTLIAGFLKKRRIELGISQGALASLCHVSRQTINRIETGRHVPNMELFLKITHHLNCYFFLAEKEGPDPDAKVMRERWGKIPEN